MMKAGSRAQQKEQTRRTLLVEGRRLFATHGYAAVGLSAIVQAAGVTKGAFYHHFESKGDLFRAVLEEVQQEVAETVAVTADAQHDSWAQLTAGCQAFLTASTDPKIQQIMLVDGPAVLGWHEWRKLDEAASVRHLTDVLTTLIDEGRIAPQPVEPLTHLLSGAMNEAALWVASSDNPDDLAKTRAALSRVLEALRVN